MDIININGDDYISLSYADNHLKTPDTIYQLKTIYFRRNKITTLYSCAPESQEQYDSETTDYWDKLYSNDGKETVLIDGFIKLDTREPIGLMPRAHDKVSQWETNTIGRNYEMNGANEVIGLVDGVIGEHLFKHQKILIDWPSSLTDFSSNKDLYAKLSDYNALCIKYGQPIISEALLKVNASIPLSPPADNLPEESLGAPTQKLVKHGVIEPIKPNNNNEEWRVMYQIIMDYEVKHGYTPRFDELFPKLWGDVISSKLTEDMNEKGKKAKRASYRKAKKQQFDRAYEGTVITSKKH